MRPTVQARELKESLLQYLSTTYALADEGARAALHEFLGNETTGMFRGPFLRVRTPFTPAAPGWEDLLDWRPKAGWTPYAHQAAAFARLSTKDGREPLPTVLTTGTGSGKTEAFLYPVLDHCARERAAGRAGIKAVLLYPMNALATDQADRINRLLLADPGLHRVRAGLYIGERPATAEPYERVDTRRADMWATPPDLLITNYKMLDLLLQRERDVPLWADADPRFVVVDEFHTYDGAQGTDVAMLLRRLAATLGVTEPERPLGRICPVATSATLGAADDDARADVRRSASVVFGRAFDADAVLGEHRQSVDEFLPPAGFDPALPQPTPEELAALPDPARGETALAELAFAVTGSRDLDPVTLGETLKQHPLTAAVLHASDGAVRTSAELLNVMWRVRATSWSRAVAQQPEVAATALARFVALLSVARVATPVGERPFVHVEVHQWVRSVARLMRGVLAWPRAEFHWDAPGAAHLAADHAPTTTMTASGAATVFLPAIYCRACGRSGWAVFSPESDDRRVELDSIVIRRASTSRDKVRVRNLIAATDAEAKAGRDTGSVQILDTDASRLRLPSGTDYTAAGDPELSTRDSAFVLAHLGKTANTAAEHDWCPACEEHNAIRYLGTGPAALAAAAITQLFTGGELDVEQHEDKALMFNDSVQDAAHRAGFVASRSFTFSLRALLNRYLAEDTPIALNELMASVIAATSDPATLAAVVPADLHDLRGVRRLLAGRGRGDRPTWELIGQRLAFDAMSEFGFRSRNGRTLELTRTAAALVHIPDPAAVVALVKAAHETAAADQLEPSTVDDSRYLALVRVFLERLRTRGAVSHQWLAGYLREAGTSRYPVWGGRPAGMRAFPRGVAAPRFLLAAPKDRSEFDVATGRLSWYERWVQRCLALPRVAVPAFWQALLPELTAAGLLSVGTPKDGSALIYGLQPGNISVQRLTDEDVNTAFVRCPRCFWEQTVHPVLLAQWHAQPCPAYRCDGELAAGDRRETFGSHHRERDFRNDYYRRLYREAGTYQVITAEHTGMLTRAEREKVEEAFKSDAFDSPNVLSCTPTLELGIDVGDLSAVVLAALPRRPANYAQQVGRAGRRTGNAYLLTIPDRSRRDLYFLDQPKEMIAGQILPPGAHLSAIEILRRQYLAHLLDLAAHGRMIRPDGVTLRALPAQAPALFGDAGYLPDLIDAAFADGDALVERFLALFPPQDGEEQINADSRTDLRHFATAGLRGAVERAEGEWRAGETLLRSRLRMINETRDELHESDPEAADLKAELDAERRTIGRRLADLGTTPAQEALCALGLLPNYALLDATTTLNATLYWSEETPAGKSFQAKLRSYERPQRYALSELAPGNTFYVNGYQHEITGIEPAPGSVRQWRFCQDCGYVRTENAADDRSACPACHSSRIADDGSCLHDVIQPLVVTSRDKRDDARIGDEKDERQQRYYTVIDAVDIPAEEIRPNTSWRHHSETFGVDFCRTAVIRRINVGPARFDRHPQDDLAGQTVRLSPFHVCSACGAAAADGKPVFDHPLDGIGSSAARRPEVKHHQPWCPLRRGKQVADVPQRPVLLAHELRTEALRILLPAATVLVAEKVYSFRAALRLGIDRHFGGDPQHLDTTFAVVPDSPTGTRRHYLVVFDRLPGGTGYLHRLTDPEKFRDTLRAARRVLLSCLCREEGRRACHRCLHRYTEERYQDIVSRHEALEILADLLGTVDDNGDTVADNWQITNLASTGLIGLDKQVESDLEARFLAALRTRVADDATVALDEDSRASAALRFTGQADVVRWRFTAQRHHDRTRTDFTFERIDGPPRTVTVYLDGHRFHASREHNRIAADAAVRARLRGEGHVVFGLTWADIDLFTREVTDAKPVWPPYPGSGQEKAREVHEDLGGARADLAATVFTNPVETLLAYLRDPDKAAWARRAAALVAGLTTAPDPVAVDTDPAGVGAALRVELAGKTFAAPTSQLGGFTVLRARDNNGLSLRYVLDSRAGTAVRQLRWSAIAILDDAPDALDTAAHKTRWRAWLYWSNLIQFLAFSGGDGVALAGSSAPSYPVDALAVCGEAPVDAAAEAPATEPQDPAWTEILELLDEDEPRSALTALAHQLAGLGKAAPVYGFELGAGRWQVDFAWPGQRLGIVLDDEGSEATHRLSVYDAEGWTVRTIADSPAELAAVLDLIPDAGGVR
ncbi:DEAD/DEAH box helicase [Amycolatopsis sp. PS_44_ISF1]|uniref:DEAD/DEAH box helicase n=1 Tax=Amycolatopsis sp. PS_44_ISF1 TaxID=2974917 RepID=UPI0028DE1511|nr:DEAD/DEAH box helicase [Amycolatopsis sp. PS_44_ISF1]MDT8910049.1 DEAD/DEAH box helicase [Amycolatopsis sp. PS_44_ISF1]